MRVACLNIHKGRGLDGRVDLERLAVFLAQSEADLIGLQEVLATKKQDQAQILARFLGMEYVFFPSIKRGSSLYGNALLCRWPIAEFKGISLPSLREQRSVLVATLTQPFPLTVAVTHLGLNNKEREAHVEKILTVLPPGPAVLMGDWNAQSPASEVQAVLGRFHDAYDEGARSASDTHTFLSHEIVPSRIDFIFVDGLKVSRYHTRGTIATDHRLVVVDLEI